MGLSEDHRKILFVYNADSGTLEALKDYFHKMASPSTYECRLCGITYGNLGMRTSWKDFLESLPFSSEFIHRDEFRKEYCRNDPLPAAFIIEGKSIQTLISKEDIDGAGSLEDLIALVRAAIDAYLNEVS